LVALASSSSPSSNSINTTQTATTKNDSSVVVFVFADDDRPEVRRYEQSHEEHEMKQQASRDAKDREEYHRHFIHVERSLQQHRDWLLEHDRRFLDQPTTTGDGDDREEQEDVLEQMYQPLKQKLATAFQEFSSAATTTATTMTMNHINTDQRRQRVTQSFRRRGLPSVAFLLRCFSCAVLSVLLFLW
jgi:hypothetical protein